MTNTQAMFEFLFGVFVSGVGILCLWVGAYFIYTVLFLR